MTHLAKQQVQYMSTLDSFRTALKKAQGCANGIEKTKAPSGATLDARRSLHPNLVPILVFLDNEREDLHAQLTTPALPARAFPVRDCPKYPTFGRMGANHHNELPEHSLPLAIRATTTLLHVRSRAELRSAGLGSYFWSTVSHISSSCRYSSSIGCATRFCLLSFMLLLH